MSGLGTSRPYPLQGYNQCHVGLSSSGIGETLIQHYIPTHVAKQT